MTGTGRIVQATLDVPVECAFHKAGAVNGLPTYPVPPVTTIRGMLYNALGRPSLLLQDRYSPGLMEKEDREQEEKRREQFRENIRIGLSKRTGEEKVHTHLLSRHQLQDRRKSDDKRYKKYVANTDTLIQPKFKLFLGGPEEALPPLKNALEDPVRPLSLGRSDDLVDVRDVAMVKVEHVEKQASLSCVVPGGNDDPEMLPVVPETFGSYGAVNGSVKLVSVSGGEVDSYYKTNDGERFVFID